jgi:hypothetical protein
VGREPRNLACIVNPKRIGIRSASCGRYATLAGVTFIPDLYAAAVERILTPMFVAQLGERGKPVRVLRRDGELPVPAPAPLK